jgi:hypothetical protein
MCDWDRELSPTSLVFSVPEDPASPMLGSPRELVLPGEESRSPPWLERVPLSENAAIDVDTLFALRDFMLQEALNVVKFA